MMRWMTWRHRTREAQERTRELEAEIEIKTRKAKASVDQLNRVSASAEEAVARMRGRDTGAAVVTPWRRSPWHAPLPGLGFAQEAHQIQPLRTPADRHRAS